MNELGMTYGSLTYSDHASSRDDIRLRGKLARYPSTRRLTIISTRLI
jgi:hypothetical protein